MLLYFFVSICSLAVCHAQTSQSICPSCSVAQNWTHVRIPKPMTLENFEAHVVGASRIWAELYYAFQNPKPYEPYYNYKLSYNTLSSNTFVESIIADEFTSPNSGNCKKVNTTLELKSITVDGTVPRARFTRQGSNPESVSTLWSSCPDKYIWIFKCTGGTNDHCPKLGIELGLAVPYKGQFQTMENLPWVSMLTDLRTTTNIIFATDDLFWSWTLGDSQFCD